MAAQVVLAEAAALLWIVPVETVLMGAILALLFKVGQAEMELMPVIMRTT
jgi:hypothetical protein